jgi:hypothetical protein
MRIIGCDLHARQQTLAMLDTETGEVANRTLMHEGDEVREFYSQLPRPVLVGIEAIGPMQWFLNLLEELGMECQVGDATVLFSFYLPFGKLGSNRGEFGTIVGRWLPPEVRPST